MTVREPSSRAVRLALVVGVLALVALVALVSQRGGAPVGAARSTSSPSTSTAPSRAATTPDSGLPTVAESALPPEGRQTEALIEAGGPFPYSQDGQAFQNRERHLPAHPQGYYREYTVRTPGESDRGARRIITGEDGEMFYTEDHYSSFRQIQVGT